MRSFRELPRTLHPASPNDILHNPSACHSQETDVDEFLLIQVQTLFASTSFYMQLKSLGFVRQGPPRKARMRERPGVPN